MSSVKGKIIEWVIVVKEIPSSTRNRPRTHIGYGSSLASTKVRGSAETNRGRVLNHWQKQTMWTLFEGGNYSRKYGMYVFYLSYIGCVIRSRQRVFFENVVGELSYLLCVISVSRKANLTSILL